MKDFRQRAFVGLVGLVSAGLISFGCSSSSNSTGTGGTTGTGTGGSHTGGTTGTGTGGTTAGSGGAGGATTGSCLCGPTGTGTCAAPVAALISDFSDAVVGAADAGTNAGKITFGSSTTVQGGVVTFQDSVSTAGTATISGGALTFMASVAPPSTSNMYPYNGFVAYINGPACTDAHTYTGVSFSISGDPGMCSVVFSINDSSHGNSASDPRDTGTSSSYSPQLVITTMVTSTKATVQVPFNDASFANGSPAFAGMIDSMDITGIQWQFQNSSTATAACTGSITVDDIKFY